MVMWPDNCRQLAGICGAGELADLANDCNREMKRFATFYGWAIGCGCSAEYGWIFGIIGFACFNGFFC